MKPMNLTLVAGLVFATGLTGAAQAAPLNIWSASRAQEASSPQIEQVQRRYYRGHRHHYHRRGINPGAAAAIGVIGGIAAGAAIANSRDRYYYDDGYYADGPVYRSGPTYAPNVGNCSNRPNNYPTDQC